jgi:hypothetical protein
MPELRVMKLGSYIIPPEAILMNPPISNTNITAYQIVEAEP